VINLNQRLGRKALQWHAGYGVVSFGTKDMDWVNNYIRRQKEHHANGALFDRLERITTGENGDVRAQAAQREAR
jgi:putative transposase